jgi:hypothetical protein
MAPHRALETPDILRFILEQLHPDAFGAYEFFSTDEWSSDSETTYSDANNGFRALAAATRVNHLWFDVAVPLLWRKPFDTALDLNAVCCPDRRTFYANHIQEVNIGDRNALWHAIAGSSKRNHLNRSVGGDLQFPELKGLHVSFLWRESPMKEVCPDQDPLLRLISPNIVSLKCFLTPALVQRLVAVHMECLGLQEVDTDYPAALHGDGRDSVQGQPRRMNLRKLYLFHYFLVPDG